MKKPPIILASASQSRQTLLRQSGVEFDVIVSGLDEDVVKQTFLKDGNPKDLALVLASSKASMVAEKHPDALVIGADQTLNFEDAVYDKPKTFEEARDRLLRFRNQTHTLESALAVFKGSENLWSYSDTSYLTMRGFSPEFLGRYLAHEGEEVLATVGGYKIEGLGIQLFEKIEGSFFSILGLPLLPLLAFFRSTKVIQS